MGVGGGGDTNHNFWRHSVQLIGDATALGLHRLTELSVQRPSSLLFAEQSKRLFVVAFAHEKHMAIFLGER